MTFEYQINTTKGQMLRICVLQRGKVVGYWVKSLNSVEFLKSTEFGGKLQNRRR